MASALICDGCNKSERLENAEEWVKIEPVFGDGSSVQTVIFNQLKNESLSDALKKRPPMPVKKHYCLECQHRINTALNKNETL